MTIFLKRVKSDGGCHSINTKKPCHFLNVDEGCSQGYILKYPCADLKRGVFVFIETSSRWLQLIGRTKRTTSEKIYLQQMGRPLRKKEGDR